MNVIHHNSTINKNERTDMSSAQVSYEHFQRLMKGGVFLMVVLSFILLISLNSIATRGFALEQIKSDRLTIVKELEQIEIDLAIPMSLYALQSSSQVQDMAVIDEKNYLYVKNGRLAMMSSSGTSFLR